VQIVVFWMCVKRIFIAEATIHKEKLMKGICYDVILSFLQPLLTVDTTKNKL